MRMTVPEERAANFLFQTKGVNIARNADYFPQIGLLGIPQIQAFADRVAPSEKLMSHRFVDNDNLWRILAILIRTSTLYSLLKATIGSTAIARLAGT